MSGKVSGAIWDLELKGVRQLVLLAMADHADHQGENVRPSVGLIAWKTGYSERQVQRTIKTLVSDGLLVKQDEPPGRPIIYRIDVDAGIKKQAYRAKNVTPDIAMSPLTPECHPQVRHLDVTPRGDTQMSPEPSLQSSEQTPLKEKDSAVSDEPAQAAKPVDAKIATTEKPKRKPNEWYDFIVATWGKHEGVNTRLSQMLQGTSKIKGYKEYNFAPAATLDELREWRDWYFWYDRQPDGTYRKRSAVKALSIVGKHGAIQSSVYEFRLWKAIVPPADMTHSDQDPIRPSEYIVPRAKGNFKYPDLKKTGTEG